MKLYQSRRDHTRTTPLLQVKRYRIGKSLLIVAADSNIAKKALLRHNPGKAELLNIEEVRDLIFYYYNITVQ